MVLFTHNICKCLSKRHSIVNGQYLTNDYSLIHKAIFLWDTYSSCFPIILPPFFQLSLSASNSLASESENFWVDKPRRSGWPAFTQAVYQKEATLTIARRILLSTIPPSFLL